jgi:acyl-CoA thioesterase YciA
MLLKNKNTHMKTTTEDQEMKLITKRIVLASDIGIHGNLFGGTLMAWMDEAAAAFATEYCYTPNMVTLRVGEMMFKKPLKAGHHVRIYGMVQDLGNTSITLLLEARKYSLYSGEETVVCSTNTTFVRIDDDGTPTAIGESVRKKFAQRVAQMVGEPTLI